MATRSHKLTAEKLRTNLLLSALYLSAYELLSYSIVDGVESNLSEEYARNEWKKEFAVIKKTKCLEKKKRTDRFFNACYWLIKRGILTDKDIDKLEAIRNHRNFLAHQLIYILIEKSYDVDLKLLKDIRKYIHQIDTFNGMLTIYVEPGTLNIIEPTEKERAMEQARIVMLDLLLESVFKKKIKKARFL